MRLSTMHSWQWFPLFLVVCLSVLPQPLLSQTVAPVVPLVTGAPVAAAVVTTTAAPVAAAVVTAATAAPVAATVATAATGAPVAAGATGTPIAAGATGSTVPDGTFVPVPAPVTAPLIPTTSAPMAGGSVAPTPSAQATSSPTTEAEKWSGCVDPSAPELLVTIGKTTVVCLQIGNSKDWSRGVNYIRLAFAPIADTYSRLFIPNSYEDLVVNTRNTIWDSKDITLGVASQSSLSFLRTYRDFATTNIFPFLTAIIDVQKGKVRGITWDNACLFCNKFTECLEVTWNYAGELQNQTTSGQPTSGCFINEEECNTLGANETACDLLLYVVWTGTDAKGKTFQSSASRYSAFPVQNLEDRFFNTLPSVGGAGRRRELVKEMKGHLAEKVVDVVPEF